MEEQLRQKQAPSTFKTINKNHQIPASKHSRSSSSSSSASSQSSERIVYNDVSNLRKFDNINLAEEEMPVRKENATQKKKAAPPPPMSKTNTYTVMPNTKDSPLPPHNDRNNLNFNINIANKDKNGSDSSSSSSSSESSPELRKKKESMEKDRQEVRSSIQAAPESYRKASSYIEAKSSYDPSQMTKGVHQYEDVDEVSSTSSKSSIEATPITPATTTSSDFRQHIEGIFDDFCVTPEKDSRDSSNKNNEFAPQKSSFSSEDEIVNGNERGSSYNHEEVDVIDDHSLEKIDNENANQDSMFPKIQPRTKKDSVSSNSSSSSKSTSASEFSLEQLPSATKVNQKPPVPQKPEHLMSRSQKAKLDTSFSSNGMDISVYRMVEGSPILNHKSVPPPQQFPDQETNTIIKNKNEYETETDSESEKETLRQALQRTSSTSSISSSSSASSVSIHAKAHETTDGYNQEPNANNIRTESKSTLLQESPALTSKAHESFNAWSRPPLQTQNNMEEDDASSPSNKIAIKQCVPVNEDSYSSTDSTSSDGNQSENESIASTKDDLIAKPSVQAVLPNFITIGRTTSIEGNQNSTSFEAKGTIT